MRISKLEGKEFMPNSPKKFYVPIPLETEKIGKLALDAAYKVRLGFLVNFNVPHLKDGIKRIVV